MSSMSCANGLDAIFRVGRSQPSQVSPTTSSERATILAAAMAELPALCREALTLRFEEGMKLEEIAEVTHAPLSTVKSRVRRGLEAMRQKLCKERSEERRVGKE